MFNKSNNWSADLFEKFQLGFRWNLFGSILFESLKVGHTLLLSYFLVPTDYGLVGTLFATMYLAIKIADSGLAYTIHPFYLCFMYSKRNFKKLFFTYSLLSLLPTLLCGMILFFYLTRWSINPSYFILFSLLIVSETIRSFLRQFLHVAFQSKPIIILENLLFILYLGIIWLPFFFSKTPLTLATIFIPFLIDSLSALCCFSIIIVKLYKKLSDKEEQLPPHLAQRLYSTRFFDFVLRLSRDLFSTNILTPLFAYKFGLKAAGIFYLISTIALALQTIIKTAIGHPGNALLAMIKKEATQTKQAAFSLLSSKLINLLLLITVGIIINVKLFFKLGTSYAIEVTTIVFACIYTIMILSDLFFILYESFYVLEEKISHLCLIKCIEFLGFYGIISFMKSLSMYEVLTALITIRCLGFIAMGWYAFYRWQLLPSISLQSKSLSFCASILLLITFFI